MKKIFKVLKKILLAVFILYGYNILLSPLGYIIPINYITVPIVTVLGFPGLLSLVLINIIIY
jgi:inhibitor of the pro-sigma K processing machinery